MGSNKSIPKQERAALKPRRKPGKERVAALMEAASSVFAEKGFEAATMAEIAVRAGALIGSLYHFFPHKEALADALIERYAGLVEAGFDRLESQAASMSIEALADSLVFFLIQIPGESKAIRALLEARAELSEKRLEFRKATLGRIARTLRLRAPGLPLEKARSMAIVLLHNTKTMKTLVADHGGITTSGAPVELRDMTRLYLAGKLRDQD
jgi:AcrR family transcriptional regulator